MPVDRDADGAADGPCRWMLDPDPDSAVWWTTCGVGQQFFDGGPAANSYRFCPYCGRPVAGDAL